MKTLYLVRHAKSDWNNAELTDFERPLNQRGYQNANVMANLLADKKFIPDLIVSSPAIRALSTALIFSMRLHYNTNTILIKHELYESTVNHYLDVVQNLNDDYKTVMLFAHNPTITAFADFLCNNLPAQLSTCAIAGIQFNTKTWRTIHASTGNLILFDYPKKNT